MKKKKNPKNANISQQRMQILLPNKYISSKRTYKAKRRIGTEWYTKWKTVSLYATTEITMSHV